MDGGVLASVQGLLTNILASLPTPFEQVKALGELVREEPGRRALSHMLFSVMEKMRILEDRTLALAQAGIELTKHGRRGQPKCRVLRLLPSGMLAWGGTKRNAIDLRTVEQVFKGKQTRLW
jgi:hypothetical protein